jgi:hypothetical protein
MAAFFKLALQDGSEREWRSLSAVVGRASSGRERDDLIDLGEQPRLSREHLAIFYDPAKRRWMAKVCAQRAAAPPAICDGLMRPRALA